MLFISKDHDITETPLTEVFDVETLASHAQRWVHMIPTGVTYMDNDGAGQSLIVSFLTSFVEDGVESDELSVISFIIGPNVAIKMIGALAAAMSS
jgi:hypothetical protein